MEHRTCKHCKEPLTGKKQYCDDACRMAYSRATRTNEPEQIQPEHDNSIPTVREVAFSVTIEPAIVECEPYNEPRPTGAEPMQDVQFSMEPKYATRTNPDKLNTGAWMNSEQLAQAGFSANRVPIPGDTDYVGVATC